MSRCFRMSVFMTVALLAAILSGGCEDDGPSSKKTSALPVIGVLLYEKNDVYISLVTQALQQSLADRATLVLHYAASDQLVQNEQIRSMVAQKADALIINLVEPHMVSVPLKEAQQYGIPIVFFNREPDLSTIKKYEKAAFIGTEAKEAGVMQGELIQYLWTKHPEYDRNRDGLVQYVMIQGNSDSPEALARTEYSVAEAQKRGLRMRQVGETFICDWGREPARQAIEMLMAARSNEVELVISNNDAMALGAIDVLKEHGYNRGDPKKHIPVIGVDAIPAAVEAVREGSLSATVKQDDRAMGEAIARLTLNALGHKDFLDSTPYAWDASGIAVRIPYVPFRP